MWALLRFLLPFPLPQTLRKFKTGQRLHKDPSYVGDGLATCLIVLDCRGGSEDAAIHLLPRPPLSLSSVIYISPSSPVVS